MVSRKVFLKSKLENFKTYLKTHVRDSPSASNSFLSYIEQFDVNNEEQLLKFSQFILFKVKPSINSLDLFLDSILKEQNIEIKLSEENRQVIKRYLSLFVELLND